MTAAITSDKMEDSLPTVEMVMGGTEEQEGEGEEEEKGIEDKVVQMTIPESVAPRAKVVDAAVLALTILIPAFF